jgi:hypothetical protein
MDLNGWIMDGGGYTKHDRMNELLNNKLSKRAKKNLSKRNNPTFVGGYVWQKKSTD